MPLEPLSADDAKGFAAVMNGTAQTSTQDTDTGSSTTDTTDPNGATGDGAAAAPADKSKDNGGATASDAAAAATTATNTSPAFDITTLGFKTPEELQAKLGRLTELEKENQQLSEYKAGPKFKSDRAKFIAEFANEFEGMELERARQLLDVTSLDLNNTPDQRIRFEAFRLRPENKGLTQEELNALFIDEETQRYGNPQDEANPPTETQKIRAKQATAQAKAQLQTVIEGWNKTRTVERTPAEIAQEKLEYNQLLTKELSSFDGLNGIKLQAQNAKGEKFEGSLNFKVDAAKQLPAVLDALRDPSGWLDSLFEKLNIYEAGKQHPNFKSFAEFATRIIYFDDLLNQAYQQGSTDHESNRLKTARNIADPAAGATGSQEPPPVDEKKEKVQGFLKTVGLVK